MLVKSLRQLYSKLWLKEYLIVHVSQNGQMSRAHREQELLLQANDCHCESVLSEP